MKQRYDWLDIPFKTMIKPTMFKFDTANVGLDIPFKTMIKPTFHRMRKLYFGWIYHSKQ